jgi:hypothetical protein
MWGENAFVIPSPTCWIVCIEGVGDAYECPKNCLDCFVFQLMSAVHSILMGQGVDMAHWNIEAAFGLLGGKV